MPRRQADPALAPLSGPVVGGIDEAGRGPGVGPLVMAGVAVADAALPRSLGCKDSKLVAPERRRAIDRALRAAPRSEVTIEVRVVDAAALDAARRGGATLTGIEVEGFQSIAAALGSPRVIVDAAHTSEAKFGELVRAGLPPGITVVSEHKADVNHPVVGAASIIAKVRRDAEVAKLGRRLERELGLPLGSGYASDPVTRAFLVAWRAQFGTWPEGTRTTWATIRDMLAPKATTLDSFEP